MVQDAKYLNPCGIGKTLFDDWVGDRPAKVEALDRPLKLREKEVLLREKIKPSDEKALRVTYMGSDIICVPVIDGTPNRVEISVHSGGLLIPLATLDKAQMWETGLNVLYPFLKKVSPHYKRRDELEQAVEQNLTRLIGGTMAEHLDSFFEDIPTYK